MKFLQCTEAQQKDILTGLHLVRGMEYSKARSLAENQYPYITPKELLHYISINNPTKTTYQKLYDFGRKP